MVMCTQSTEGGFSQSMHTMQVNKQKEIKQRLGNIKYLRTLCCMKQKEGDVRRTEAN